MADGVSTRADGMFIFATLVIGNLFGQVSRKDLRKEIQEMPRDLDQVYERTLHRILDEAEPAESRAAKKLLSWLVCAIRPLRWHEIQGAASYDSEDHSFHFEDGKFRKGPKELCGSLIDIYADDEVRLVHLTAKLYLERNVLKTYEQELDLLCLCLDYLRLPSFGKGQDQDAVTCLALEGHYAFMDYALASWPVHLQRFLRSPPLAEDTAFKKLSGAIRSFFQQHPIGKIQSPPKDKSMTIMLQPFAREQFFEQLVQFLKTAETMICVSQTEGHESEGAPLQLVEQVSLVRAVIERIATGHDSNQKIQIQGFYGPKPFKYPKVCCQRFYDGFDDRQERDQHLSKHMRPYLYTYPECHAALIGCATAQQLRRHELDYHSENPDPSVYPWHQKPSSIDIYKELRNGNREAFDLWLDQFENRIPIEELRWNKRCQGALRAAIEVEDLEILRVVLDRADPELLQNSPFRPHSSAANVLRAALKAHSDLAFKEILSRVDHLTDHDVFSLFTVASSRALDTSAMELLQQHLREVAQLKGGQRRLASYLSVAIRSGRLGLVRFLIHQKGVRADWESQSEGHTALGLTTILNQVEVARFLLDSGTCKDECGYAFVTACRNGHDKIVQMLVDNGADVNGRISHYKSVLQVACEEGYDKIVHILVDNGADVNPEEEYDDIPLHIACGRGHDKIVQMLVDYGVDVNSKTSQGNALIAACANGHDEIVQILIRHGADVNAKVETFPYNALRAASMYWHDKIVQILIDNGANVDPEMVNGEDMLNDFNFNSFLQSVDDFGNPASHLGIDFRTHWFEARGDGLN